MADTPKQEPSHHSNRWYNRHPQVPRPTIANNPSKVPQVRKPPSQRMLSFIEQPLFIAALGIIGGIVGFVFYAPIFGLCALAVLLAFHRAEVVAGESPWKIQVPAYVLLCALVFGGLYGLHVKLDKKLAEANTSLARLVASYVVKILPQPTSGRDTRTNQQPFAEPNTTTAPKRGPSSAPDEFQLQEVPPSEFGIPTLVEIVLGDNRYTYPAERLAKQALCKIWH
jgi:hypothetical protein